MHNYLKKLGKVWDQKKYPPNIYDVIVAHDEWCSIYSGQECNCDPDITIKKKKV